MLRGVGGVGTLYGVILDGVEPAGDVENVKLLTALIGAIAVGAVVVESMVGSLVDDADVGAVEVEGGSVIVGTGDLIAGL